MPRTSSEDFDVKGSFDTYLEYTKSLRTWLVSFGAGTPAVFLVNDSLAKRLQVAGVLRLVVLLCLAGVAMQIANALVNKVANWYVHAGYTDGTSFESTRHKVAEWVARQFWLDVAFDILTIAAYSWAMLLLLHVLA